MLEINEVSKFDHGLEKFTFNDIFLGFCCAFSR